MMIRLNKLKQVVTLSLLVGVLIALNACSDDDEIVTLPLEGTLWTLTSTNTNSCTDDSANEESTIPCTSEDCITIFFFDNQGVRSIISNGTSEVATSNYLISSTTLTTDLFGLNTSYEISIVGNVLTLTTSNDFTGCITQNSYSGRAVSNAAEFIQELLVVNPPLEETVWFENNTVKTECTNSNESGNFGCIGRDCNQLTFIDGEVELLDFQDGSIVNIITGTYEINGMRMVLNLSSRPDELNVSFRIENGELALLYPDPISGCDTIETFTALN